MPYGNLNLEMRSYLETILSGRTVYDLGAGDCDHADTLIKCGAEKVVAVEKSAGAPRPRNPKVEVVTAYIHHVPIPEDLDVVFLGWPQNTVIPGLLPWVDKCRTLVYLGSNFRGTACGFPTLYERMMYRKLLKYIPDHRNNLVVVGEPLGTLREPTPEEAAAFSVDVVW